MGIAFLNGEITAIYPIVSIIGIIVHIYFV